MKMPPLHSTILSLLLAGCAADSMASKAGPSTRPATTPATTAAVPPTPDPAERQFLTGVVQLTDGFEKAGEGYFSRDMKWVIFQATPRGEKNYQMHVAPLSLEDGAASHVGRPTRISPPNSRNTCGYFAPDGGSLIFGSTAGKEDPEEPSAGYQRQGGTYRWDFPKGMEIYRANDWQAGAAAGGAADLAKPANRLTNNDAYDAEGAFSPDGKWICFTSLRTGDAEIWVMRADGSNPVQITHAKGYDGGPFFSPDGKRLVYRSDRKGNDLLQLFVADLAFDDAGNVTGAKAERQLTDDENVNWGPSWHPDGRHLIFATSRHGHQNYELYTIRDDGTYATRITYCDGFDGLPVFSPDGKYVMWSGKRSKDNTTQLFLARFHSPTDW